MDKFSQTLRSHKEASFDYHSQGSNNTLDLHYHIKETQNILQSEENLKENLDEKHSKKSSPEGTVLPNFIRNKSESQQPIQKQDYQDLDELQAEGLEAQPSLENIESFNDLVIHT